MQVPGIYLMQISDELSCLYWQRIVVQGAQLLEQEDKLICGLLSSAFQVQLGGQSGKRQGFGHALAVHLIDSKLAKHRSELGNRLAEHAEMAGLEPIGVVAYVEVRVNHP
jgi:hypothetical protein